MPMLPDPPPPIPADALPRSERDWIDWIRLLRSPRVGATTFRRLVCETGGVAAALAQLPQIARDAGVKDYAARSPAAAEAEIAAGLRAGARPLFLGGAGYSALLAGISDAPPILWARGDAALADRQVVAMVGARNSSALGRRMAAHLAGDLGQMEFTIASGLARGIDTEAHTATLETGTIAVLAGGIDVIYPQENEALAEQIVERGLLLSEMPPGMQPQARHFPRRNRIISGLSQALVVVEGAAKSGSLITAKNALDQGREVLAVPGHPFDARAAGCNILIRDGATLVRSAADIAEALSRPAPEKTVRTLPQRVLDLPPAPKPVESTARPGNLDVQIANLLGPAPVSEDILIRQLRAPSAAVLATLAEMDLRGVIERHPGGLVSAHPG